MLSWKFSFLIIYTFLYFFSLRFFSVMQFSSYMYVRIIKLPMVLKMLERFDEENYRKSSLLMAYSMCYLYSNASNLLLQWNNMRSYMFNSELTLRRVFFSLYFFVFIKFLRLKNYKGLSLFWTLIRATKKVQIRGGGVHYRGRVGSALLLVLCIELTNSIE